MPSLLLRDAAREDLRAAYSWYETRRAGLGSEFIASVREVLHAIESNPVQYPITVDDIHKAPLRRFPYVVYYAVIESAVSVIAVMHGRRHPRRWQDRR